VVRSQSTKEGFFSMPYSGVEQPVTAGEAVTYCLKKGGIAAA
jgi:hypothetical protein